MNMRIQKITTPINEMDVKGQTDYCMYDCVRWYGNSPTNSNGCQIKINAYNSTKE